MIVKEFLLGTPRCPWSSSGGKWDGDESRVSGGVSGKIHSVRASENADDGVRGGEGVQGKVKKKEEVLPLSNVLR